MTDRMLLIDQGNTRLKWVSATKGKLEKNTAGRGDLDAFTRAARTGELGRPDVVLVSSVTSKASARNLSGFCETQWGVKARKLETTEKMGEVHNGYLEPAKLGVDRWLAIVGAVSRHGKPVVVWDMGTAATLDAVDSAGQHIGGMIYPGPATMLKALRRDTRLKVPEVFEQTSAGPGRSTSACIGNGVFAAQVGALNQFLRSTQERLGEEPKIVLTGGAAKEIPPLLDFQVIHDPWLVFRGMLIAGIR